MTLRRCAGCCLLFAVYGSPGMFAAPAGAQAPSGWGQQPGSATGQTFQDPSGRFKLVIPAGWQMKQEPGQEASFTHGESWIQLVTSTSDSAADAANTAANTFHQAFPTFNLLNRGASKVGGHDSWGMNFDGVNGKGQKRSVLLISESAGGGHFLTVVSSVPVEQAAKMNDDVMKLANSVRFQGE